jgi:hypothetical protein
LKIATLLLQLRILRLGLLQDGDVNVGILPEGEEILIRRLGFDSVTGDGIRTGELKAGERAQQKVLYDSGMIEELLELCGSRGAILLGQIGQAANVWGIHGASGWRAP